MLLLKKGVKAEGQGQKGCGRFMETKIARRPRILEEVRARDG